MAWTLASEAVTQQSLLVAQQIKSRLLDSGVTLEVITNPFHCVWVSTDRMSRCKSLNTSACRGQFGWSSTMQSNFSVAVSWWITRRATFASTGSDRHGISAGNRRPVSQTMHCIMKLRVDRPVWLDLDQTVQLYSTTDWLAESLNWCVQCCHFHPKLCQQA